MISNLVYAIIEEYPTTLIVQTQRQKYQKKSCNMFKVGNKNTTTTSLTSKFQHTPLFSVFIVDF